MRLPRVLIAALLPTHALAYGRPHSETAICFVAYAGCLRWNDYTLALGEREMNCILVIAPTCTMCVLMDWLGSLLDTGERR